MRRRGKLEQTEFAFGTWGGAREGAGRKPSGAKAGLPHDERPAHAARIPLHVTLRLAAGLPSLRGRGAHAFVLHTLAAASERASFRVVHYSAQSNHLHLVCEAANRHALIEGVRGLCVRLARGLNRLWKRRGRVLADRPHVRPLRTPREVRNVLAYVLHNAARHGIVTDALDPCSSAAWFDGWGAPWLGAARIPSPLPPARTWLLATGWKLHGPIPPPNVRSLDAG